MFLRLSSEEVEILHLSYEERIEYVNTEGEQHYSLVAIQLYQPTTIRIPAYDGEYRVTDEQGLEWDVTVRWSVGFNPEPEVSYVDIYLTPVLYSEPEQQLVRIGGDSHECDSAECGHCNDEEWPEICSRCPGGCSFCRAWYTALAELRARGYPI